MDDETVAARQAVDGTVSKRFPSVLVVEASAGQARFAADLLREIGFDHIWTGTDSATAFADIHQLRPDLLVLAVDVEPLDGLTLAQTIRAAARDTLKDLPILFLTPFATEHQVREVREIRCSALLVKPAGPDSLRSHIARLVRGSPPPATRGDRPRVVS